MEGVPRDRVEPLVADYEARARRAIDRKRKKTLDDLEDALSRASAVAVDAFVDAALRTEARAAFLASGDLRASLDAVAITEAGLGEALRTPGRVALAAVLTRPVARDLVAFAMGGDATALRRSLGTLWRERRDARDRGCDTELVRSSGEPRDEPAERSCSSASSRCSSSSPCSPRSPSPAAAP